MNNKMRDASEWCNKTMRLLDLCSSSFELSLLSLPVLSPCQLRLPNRTTLTFDNPDQVDRLEHEISDAFFLRLKGLIEAQLKRLCKPNWENGTKLIRSIQDSVGNLPSLSPEDLTLLGQFCEIRNVIAHCDGRVDEKATKHIPALQTGTDVWMNRETFRNWVGLCTRLINAIGNAQQNTPADEDKPRR